MLLLKQLRVCKEVQISTNNFLIKNLRIFLPDFSIFVMKMRAYIQQKSMCVERGQVAFSCSVAAAKAAASFPA